MVQSTDRITKRTVQLPKIEHVSNGRKYCPSTYSIPATQYLGT